MEIKLEHITKIFVDKQKNETRAVDDLNVTVPSGKLIGLLGPSGCGKSTTLYMIAGLHEPTKGKILFGDEDVTFLSPEKRGIGLVFQNYALYPHMTIRENIMFPLQNLKYPKEEIEERTEKIAKLVGIANQLEKKPSQLSGGQQQRVAIARALVKTPKVLLLDEPLSNLDARLRIQMREEIKRIQRKTGTTTVFVTHDQEEAMSICDQIVLMEYGVEQQRGIPQDIYDNPKNLFVAKFLGTPPINLFKGEIKNKKLYVGKDEILDASNAIDTTKTWEDIKANHPVCAKDNSQLTLNVVGSKQDSKTLEALLDSFSPLAGNFKINYNYSTSNDGFAKVQGKKSIKLKKSLYNDTKRKLKNIHFRAIWEKDANTSVETILKPLLKVNLNLTFGSYKNNYGDYSFNLYENQNLSNLNLPTPERVNRTFKGWAYDDELIDLETFDFSNIKGRLYLKAKWEKIDTKIEQDTTLLDRKFNAFFHLNGGTIDESYSALNYKLDKGELIQNEVLIPVRKGFIFKGWSVDGIVSNTLEEINNAIQHRYDEIEKEKLIEAERLLLDTRSHLGVTNRELNFTTERGAVRFMKTFLNSAIIPVVSKNLEIDDIDAKTLKLILDKKIKSWNEINENLPDTKIFTFLQEKTCGTRELAFAKLDIIRREKGILSWFPVSNEKVFKDEDMLIEQLQFFPVEKGMGISFLSYQKFNELKAKNPDLPLKELSVNGIYATDENIQDQTYFFATQGKLIANSNPILDIDKIAVAFLDYLKTKEGKAICEKTTKFYPRKEFVVGIRPEGYEVSDKGIFNLKYDYYESIGRDLSLVCKHDNSLMPTFRVILNNVKDAEKLKDGNVKLNIKKNKIYVFDSETGERVL